eukprot:Clim_evm56s33 gene=Clim_evmTU56s33
MNASAGIGLERKYKSRIGNQLIMPPHTHKVGEEVYTFRELLDTDKSDVAEISKNIYNGLDYMIPNYENLLSNPDIDWSALVSPAHNNKVLALVGMRYIDHGETVTVIALRVHEDFGGRGLAQKLVNWVLSNLPEHRARDLKLIRAVCQNDSVSQHIFTNRFNFEKHNLSYFAAILWSDLTEQHIDELEEYKTETVARVDDVDKEQIIRKIRQLGYDFLDLDWVPYAHMEETPLWKAERVFAIEGPETISHASLETKMVGKQLVATVYASENAKVEEIIAHLQQMYHLGQELGSVGAQLILPDQAREALDQHFSGIYAMAKPKRITQRAYKV